MSSPTTDFELIYTVSQEQIGANLLSYCRSRHQRGLLHAAGRARASPPDRPRSPRT